MKIFLAPMEGVVDFLMRDILTAMGGIDYCVTEFVRVTDRIVPNHVFYKYCPELKTQGKTLSGIPVFVQLLGGQPIPLARNAQIAVKLGALGIDLNFGCPAKTVNRHDGGATLLRCPERIYNIVNEIRKTIDPQIPVSAKIRLGFEDKSLFMENSLAAQEGGASWLTVHARTKKEGYKPPAHWEYIARINSQLDIPVIANGDIFSKQDLVRCQQITGCEQFMIGRGTIKRPDLCANLAGAPEMNWADVLLLLSRFLSRARQHTKPSYAVSRFKQWSRQITRHYDKEDFFTSIKRLECADDIEHQIQIHLNNATLLPTSSNGMKNLLDSH